MPCAAEVWRNPVLHHCGCYCKVTQQVRPHIPPSEILLLWIWIFQMKGQERKEWFQRALVISRLGSLQPTSPAEVPRTAVESKFKCLWKSHLGSHLVAIRNDSSFLHFYFLLQTVPLVILHAIFFTSSKSFLPHLMLFFTLSGFHNNGFHLHQVRHIFQSSLVFIFTGLFFISIQRKFWNTFKM